jgi:hypothetical protein
VVASRTNCHDEAALCRQGIERIADQVCHYLLDFARQAKHWLRFPVPPFQLDFSHLQVRFIEEKHGSISSSKDVGA